jgi:UDP-N-acetylglucosamine enolpyruvyl transferase
MSEIELGPVSDRLDDEELKTLQKLLDQAGAKYNTHDDSQITQTIAARLSEDAMTEFLDRLEAHDISADIYLPAEFEGRLSVGEVRVASTQVLAEVLEEMKEELAVEEDEEYEEDEEEEEEDEDEEEDEGTVIEAQLRNIWRLVNDACGESVDKSVPLHLRV